MALDQMIELKVGFVVTAGIPNRRATELESSFKSKPFCAAFTIRCVSSLEQRA